MSDFKAFYKQQRNGLFAYLMRSTGDYHLSGDILQESFTRYLEKYGEQRLNPALLYAIARNAIVDGYRKRVRHAELTEDHGSSNPNPESQTMIRENYRKVLKAMQGLEQQERDILSMVVSSGLPYREIAAVVGISEANVKVRVHRARVKLKKIMETSDK